MKVAPKGKASAWAKELYEEFALVRKSLESHAEEDIDQAIKEAVEETRAEAR